MTDEQILEQLGLTNVDDESRAVLIAQVNAVVEMRLIRLVTDLLTDEQLARFKQLQEAGDNDGIWKLLNEEVTNIDELRQGVLADYLRERAERNQ